MCGGMEYQYTDPATGQILTRKVYFPIPRARIPVILEDEAPEPVITMCRWGRRQGEDPEFDVPVTGWARLLSLKEGKWNQYNPKRIKIPALRWMEKDDEKQSHWFNMTPDRAILGVLLENRGEHFAYVVTKPSIGLFADVHDRMPVVTELKMPAPAVTLQVARPYPAATQTSLF